jgi:hypothetical protein
MGATGLQQLGCIIGQAGKEMGTRLTRPRIHQPNRFLSVTFVIRVSQTFAIYPDDLPLRHLIHRLHSLDKTTPKWLAIQTGEDIVEGIMRRDAVG